jgi:transaldolase
MKVFLDTADILAIKKHVDTGLIDGVTTNPTLLSKESKDVKKQILAICSLVPQGVVSVEVTEHEPHEVYLQAKEIAELAKNIAVKIPCHAPYYQVINRLVKEGVLLNITLVFTLTQALMMSKLGVGMISPFVGRWDDIDIDGIEVVSDIRHMLDQYAFKTELLAASIRSVRHFHQAILVGADSITLPVDVFEKSLEHPLTIKGMEKFAADWRSLGVRRFP